MIDLKQLNQIDIKTLINFDALQGGIDFNQLQNSLWRRKDVLINIALICLTIWGANAILKNKNTETTQLKTEIEELTKKTDAIVDYEKQEKIKNDFVTNAPKGFDGFTNIIDKVSVLANEANVQILSFDPDAAGKNDFFVLEKVGFLISADRYRNMLSFVKKVETAEESLRIDYWSNTEKSRGRQKTVMGDGAKNYILHLSSITLKNKQNEK